MGIFVLRELHTSSYYLSHIHDEYVFCQDVTRAALFDSYEEAKKAILEGIPCVEIVKVYNFGL